MLSTGPARGGRRALRRLVRLGRSRTRRAVGALLTITVAGGLAGGAFAFWSGSGNGDATTVLPQPLPLTFGAGAPTAQLYPGGAAGVAIVARNPNAYFVQLQSLQLDTGSGPSFVADAGHRGCDVSALTFTTQDNGGRGWRVPPRIADSDGALTIDMAAAIQMSADAADACQGATFTVLLWAPS
jgi:hypothetical protein